MKVTFMRLVCSPTLTVQPGQTVELPESEARARIAAGVAYAADPETSRPDQPVPEEEAPDADARLEDLKLPQLREYAHRAGIDITGAVRKADILAAITKARKAQADDTGNDDQDQAGGTGNDDQDQHQGEDGGG